MLVLLSLVSSIVLEKYFQCLAHPMATLVLRAHNAPHKTRRKCHIASHHYCWLYFLASGPKIRLSCPHRSMAVLISSPPDRARLIGYQTPQVLSPVILRQRVSPVQWSMSPLASARLGEGLELLCAMPPSFGCASATTTQKRPAFSVLLGLIL
ncbi:hypothetical protein B0H19DRAFT_134197 [Mycena capillaripes]|nr:hypothetical protein B0H19DRAFT_134197 [Mycena capillaripes]